MSDRRRLLFKRLGLLTIPLLLGAIAAVPTLSQEGQGRPTSKPEDSPAPQAAPGVELVPDKPDTLRLPADVVRKLGIQTATVQKATQPRTLTLAGSLALDANRLARVHTRFAGEMVEMGTMPDRDTDALSTGRGTARQVQVGDKVRKDQLLAVVWSKDLGEKKNELVDAVSQLRLDRERLEKLEEGYQRQAIPEASVRQARRDVEAALNAVSRAERTLRVWRLSDADIEAVKVESERIRQRQGKRDQDKERAWARVEVRAPFDGVVLERNVALGDIVDTSVDLFKLADLSRLTVWAHAYENQLPALLGLPTPIPWTVRLQSDPDAKPLSGRVEMIGSLVDPTQHTALVRGGVDNAEERLRAGQFITAMIELPPSAGEVVLPITALVEDGNESVVFVQPNADEPCYTLRRVKVTRRTHEAAHLAGPAALRPGERVVTSAVVALKAALEDLRVVTRKKPLPPQR